MYVCVCLFCFSDFFSYTGIFYFWAIIFWPSSCFSTPKKKEPETKKGTSEFHLFRIRPFSLRQPDGAIDESIGALQRASMEQIWGQECVKQKSI